MQPRTVTGKFLSNEIIRYINEGKDGSLHFFLLENNRLYVVDKELKKVGCLQK